MRKSDEFSVVQRQSPGVIGVAVVKYLQAVFRQAIWPLIIIFIFGGGADSFTRIVIAVSLFAGLFSIGAAVIRYLYFYFVFRDGQLRVVEGLLRKRNLSVPRQKIQRVEFEQNLVHRILKVVTLRIETAGAEGEELEIGALPLDKAERLRQILLSGKKIDSETAEKKTAEKPVFRLSFSELIRASLVRNHFRTFGIILGFLAGVYFQFQEVTDVDKWLAEWLPQWYYSSDRMSGFLLIIPPVLLLVILLTVIRTIIQYYNFTLWRTSEGYRVAYGLFSRFTNSALNIKVQYLRWRDNVLMRLVDMHGLNIYQATSVSAKRDQSLQIPFCFDEQIDLVTNDVYPDFDITGATTIKPSPRYRYVIFFRIGVIPAIIGLVYGYFTAMQPLWLLVLALWLLGIWIYAGHYTRTMYLKATPDHVFVERGILEKNRWLLRVSRLQGVSLSQNPWEARRNLSTLNLFTAAGSVSFPYIRNDYAYRLHDYFLFKIETNSAVWM